MELKFWDIMTMDCNVVEQLIRYLHSLATWEKVGNTMWQYVSYLWPLRKPLFWLWGTFYLIFLMSLIDQWNQCKLGREKFMWFIFLFIMVWNKEVPYYHLFSMWLFSMNLGRIEQTWRDWNQMLYINCLCWCC